MSSLPPTTQASARSQRMLGRDEGRGEGAELTLTANSWLVMRLMQVCTRAWAPSPSTSS